MIHAKCESPATGWKRRPSTGRPPFSSTSRASRARWTSASSLRRDARSPPPSKPSQSLATRWPTRQPKSVRQSGPRSRCCHGNLLNVFIQVITTLKSNTPTCPSTEVRSSSKLTTRPKFELPTSITASSANLFSSAVSYAITSHHFSIYKFNLSPQSTPAKRALAIWR